MNNIVRTILFLLLFSTVAYAESAYVYDSHGKRDPFVPLVGVKAAAVSSLEDIMSIEDVNLQGVAAGARGKMFVIINGEMLKEGETVGRLTVKKISKSGVKLVIDGSEHTINVYEEGT